MNTDTNHSVEIDTSSPIWKLNTPNSEQQKTLLKLIYQPENSGQNIIQYLEQNNINVNIYLPRLDRSDDHLIYMPLIYFCCSSELLSELFLYLLDKKVDLHAHIISDDQNEDIELLYYSQPKYIPLLIEHGCQLEPTKIGTNLEKLLVGGNMVKIMLFYKHNVLTKDQILQTLNHPSILFKILERLYERVYQISQRCSDNLIQFTHFYDELLNNYLNVFKFCFKNHVSFNQTLDGQSFTQRILNTYFLPLITYVLDVVKPKLDNEEFYHYSNFGLDNRQVMKFIYNEENFQKIYRIVKDKIKTNSKNLNLHKMKMKNLKSKKSK